ncbi:MAG: hypothetical protein P8N76_07480 [Pirellulaceae bacterium]|nr:hypothetical protein [Pirellulaceae bacterium]
MTINPYQTPQETEVSLQTVSAKMSHHGVGKTLLRWNIICGVSSIPSFLLGINFCETSTAIGAMLVGILLFALAYTYLDLRLFRSWRTSNPAFRRAMLTSFGVRLTASALFPIGVMADVWTGLISVTIVSYASQTLRGINIFPGYGNNTQSVSSVVGMEPIAVGLCTVLQGIFLSIILFTFMTIIYYVLLFFGFSAQTQTSNGHETDQQPFLSET